MADENTNDVFQQLEALMETGTEAEAKRFIIDHMKEFPEEVQGELAVAILADAIDERVAENDAIQRIKLEAATAIELEEEKNG